MPIRVTNTPFNTIRARSCHRYPTQNQPNVPNNPNHKSICGIVPTALADVATSIRITEIHLTYHDKSPFGVIFLKTLEESSALILSFSF